MPTPGVTLTGTLQDTSGTGIPGKVVLTLVNYGPALPRVTGTSIIANQQYTAQAAANGTFSVTFWGNYQLLETSSYYEIAVYGVDAAGAVSSAANIADNYQFNAPGSFNLSAINPIASVPISLPPSTILLTNNTWTGNNVFASASFGGPVTIPTVATGDDSMNAASTAFVEDTIDTLLAANNPWTGNETHLGTETFTGPFLQKASPIFDIRAYGGACDNATDNTAAFNSALVDAQSAGGGTILFPLGICLFNSKPNNIGNGVKLQGQGWSTNTAVGTSLIRNYVDAGTLGFITFDGNGTSARGTGSGVDDMTIGPAVGTTGGYLVKLTSTPGCVVGADCDNHRASDTKITNIFLGNGNGGTSACGLYIDGSQNTTGGSQGIRIVNVNNLRVSSTTTADCSIWMNNVAHFMGSNIVIDTGFGATPGVTVTGVGAAPNSAASANVYFSNMELVGDLVVDSASGVQTSGSVLVNGTTSMSANTANSILLGRFATIPSNSSATSTWATVKSAVPFVVPALAATSTGVLTGAAGEIFSITAATTGVLGMGSDHNVTFNRFDSTSIGFTGAKLCASTTCSAGMNVGDIQSASSATAGALWLGTDALSYVTRNAGGDVNVKQNLGFRSGTSFIGMMTAALTGSRTYTFPDAAGQLPTFLNCGTSSTCSQAGTTRLIVVNGGPIALAGGTLTITSLPFTASTSYVCLAQDSTGINPIDVVYVSGSSVTFNGTGTDSIRYTCHGN